MAVKTMSIQFSARGDADVINITDQVSSVVKESGWNDGIATIFWPSSTTGLTTIEFESGCISDLKRMFDEILPPERDYQHNLKWGDGNGHSHIRAALLKASFTVPFVDRRLTLGTWQQIIFVDFDKRSRRRKLVVQVMGE
ncbi:secondary thiamine-phosphate synthase enzyme YjbQ [Chloroflexota bacterium]